MLYLKTKEQNLFYFISRYNGASSLISLTEKVTSGRPGHGNVTFLNRNSAGSNFFRTFLISFEKDTEECTVRISNGHEEEISNIENKTFVVSDKKVTIEYFVLPCMRDGKEVRVLAQEVLKKEAKKGNFLKNWPEKKSVKIDNNTCTICLERPQLYNSMKSFNFPPILFDRMKKY